ncbi:MAG: hypothetical protein NTV94_16945 [Planctomycetota bacterium]|nr:hypothetical protein [Planctomycetota bacterium]
MSTHPSLRLFAATSAAALLSLVAGCAAHHAKAKAPQPQFTSIVIDGDTSNRDRWRHE